MKRFIEGENRYQSTLFPESLEDYIADDNPVRFIDAFVDGLDLKRLGFERAQPSETGRPGYEPTVMLKIYVYGYIDVGYTIGKDLENTGIGAKRRKNCIHLVRTDSGERTRRETSRNLIGMVGSRAVLADRCLNPPGDDSSNQLPVRLFKSGPFDGRLAVIRRQRQAKFYIVKQTDIARALQVFVGVPNRPKLKVFRCIVGSQYRVLIDRTVRSQFFKGLESESVH